MLDLSVGKSTQLRIDNSIVIFDEGHNLETALKESASAQFTQLYLKEIEASCDKLPSKLNDILNYERHGLSRSEKRRDNSTIVDEFAKPKSKTVKEAEKENKKNPIEELAEKLTNDKIRLVSRCARSLMGCIDLMNTKEGRYQDTKCSLDLIIAEMQKAGVEFNTSDTIITTLDSMASFWSMAGVMNPATVARYLTALTSLSKFISIIYPQGCMSKNQKDEHLKRLKHYYTAHLKGVFEKQTVLLSSNKLINWELDLWCLHPAIGFKRVIDNLCAIGPRSIIVTSGTLAPLQSIEDELEIKFEVRREFEHLINSNQLNVMILAESPKGYSLKSTYTEAKKPLYPVALAESLTPLFRVLPYGTLVFFPSYSLMQRVVKFWENSKPTLWSNIVKITKVFIESKDQSQFNADMTNFQKHIDYGGKAIFLGVCRGKLSEGTNLKSNHCRSVVIVGLPFPNSSDPKVIETREFYDKRGINGGNNWYNQQMRRALSQAFGRVIRSKDDFGMLFLCDPRFDQFKFSVSQWIRPFYPTEYKQNYQNLCQEVKDFFIGHNIDLSAITIEPAISSNKNGLFEIDPATRVIKNKSVGKAGARSSDLNAHLPAANPEGDETPVSSRMSPRSRQAAMIAAYTVDRETYDRVKTAQNERQNSDSTAEPAPTKTKRLKSSNVFDSIYPDQQKETHATGMKTDQILPNGASSATKSHIELITLDDDKERKQGRRIDPVEARQKLDSIKGQPSGPQYKCYICLNPADKPYVINCPCARIGCITCLKGLNKKTCGECGTLLTLKSFKQKLFNIFQRREV